MNSVCWSFCYHLYRAGWDSECKIHLLHIQLRKMAPEGDDSRHWEPDCAAHPVTCPPHLPTADKSSPGATIILTGLLPLDLSDRRPHSAMLSNISRALSPSLSPSQEVPVLPAPGFQFLDKHSNCGLVCHTACRSAAQRSSCWAPARVRSRLLIVP